MTLTRVSSPMIGGQGLSASNTAAQNTAALQALIDNQTDGGLIVVPKGCQFNLKQLDGSVNEYNLQYWAEDEADRLSGDVTAPGTNEIIYWSSNWKNNTNTDVNEWRFQAAYHPGIVLNNRENIDHYGSGSDNLGQASLVYMKDNYNQFQLQQLFINNRNTFAVSSWEVRQTFPIGSSSFGVAPVADEIIVGDTSGARGIVLAVTSSTLLVSWLYGTFQSGETVTVAGTKTSTVGLPSAPTFTYNNKPFRFVMSNESTSVGVNITPERLRSSFHVGGIVTIDTAKGGGLGTAAARLELFDDHEAPTTGGSLSIDVNGDLQLLDSSEAVIGSFDAGGSFTVTLKDAPTGNSVTPTQTCTYRESAGMVWFSIFLLNIDTTGLTSGNQIHVVGLPKTSRNSVNATANVNVLCSNVTSTAGNVMAQIVPNTSYIILFDSTTSGSANLNVSAISSGTGDLTISGCYSI